MSADTLCRERLRTERERVGDAHPFLVEELVLRAGDRGRSVSIGDEDETPLRAYTRVWDWGHKP
jgi:hypothetical protein